MAWRSIDTPPPDNRWFLAKDVLGFPHLATRRQDGSFYGVETGKQYTALAEWFDDDEEVALVVHVGRGEDRISETIRLKPHGSATVAGVSISRKA